MKAVLDNAVAEVGKVLLGKEAQIRLALACILCRGHLLIEDLPGMGKTTLSHVFAAVLGLSYKRIQFTSDLLPADVLGFNLYDRQLGEFIFHPGPVFSQVVLADEINRATPKAQSALLEAMEERQVSIEGETRKLPSPFFVIATQNPSDQAGTFILPESQTDRFLMRIHLGYPSREAERELLLGQDRRDILSQLKPCLVGKDLEAAQQAVLKVHASSRLVDYVQSIIDYTPQQGGSRGGLSPRGGIALLRAVQAWALMHGREHVLPDAILAVLAALVDHRVPVSGGLPLSSKVLQEVDIM